MAMARIQPDEELKLFPYLCFPSPWACRVFPGLYLDMPQWIPPEHELSVVKACVRSDRPIGIILSDIEVDVNIADDGEMYGGIIIKTIRTDDWLLSIVHSRITFYHPWRAPWNPDPPLPFSMYSKEQKCFRIQPSRVPFLRPQLVGLRARLAKIVEKARLDGQWGLAVLRDPDFDRDSKRDRTVAFVIGMMSGGMAPLLWKMKSECEKVALMGRTPSWQLHLRLWGCKCVGRAPTDAIYMGFHANNCPWPLPPAVPPPDEDEEGAASGSGTGN